MFSALVPTVLYLETDRCPWFVANQITLLVYFLEKSSFRQSFLHLMEYSSYHNVILWTLCLIRTTIYSLDVYEYRFIYVYRCWKLNTVVQIPKPEEVCEAMCNIKWIKFLIS